MAQKFITMRDRDFNYDNVVGELVRLEPAFSTIIKAIGKQKMTLSKEKDLFKHMSRAIIYQQLSGKAAGTIHTRFQDMFGGKATPEKVITKSEDDLREAGVSRNKALALLDLSKHILEGEVPNSRQLTKLSDEEIITRLVKVRGIGEWTAQMYLMSGLGRLDVLPAADLGVRKGFHLLFPDKVEQLKKEIAKDNLIKPVTLLKHGESWQPYRSLASWLLWRATEVL